MSESASHRLTGFSFLGLITLLLAYQLIGEIIVRFLDWPIPGPVIGMFLLFISLLFHPGWATRWTEPSQHFLRYLSLFFVPAGVGVMLHLTRVGEQWLAIAVALVISTLVSLVVTAGVMLLLMRLRARISGAKQHD
ncbi:CidA/LrgA family protein [Thiomicrospira pelophila]|uniref:CidA/LrgA family protein n=1 Tax=Thiomicrospira pelophila TaxID=934 RepID=UPI0006904412|nr:CidA/LrgA family protein [Thiomicrospira pelophila]